MKDGTVKLSGHVKDRFLERFIADEPSLSADARERLVARARSTFTSIRVRKAALRRQRELVPTGEVAPVATLVAVSTEPSSAEPVAEPERSPPVAPDAGTTSVVAPEAASPAAPTSSHPISSEAAAEASLAVPPSATPLAAAPSVSTSPPAPAFDAYSVKLVPVFQREGRDGLLARLANVGEVGQLRQMAKAQQIILPEGLRSGEASAEAVRAAIADAVARRIADRRAAAG